MLADLGGGSVVSRRQGEFDQPAVTEVLADIRMLHLNAQRIRLGVGMVRIKCALQSFVGLDTADVRFDEQRFPLGSGAPGEDFRNLGDQRLVIGLPRLSSREAAVGQKVSPLYGAAECLPLVLEQTTQEHPPFPAAVETVQGMEAMECFVGHRQGRAVGVVVILIGIGPGIGVEHGDVDGLALTSEVPRPEAEDDARDHRRGGVLVRPPVGLHDPTARLHDLFNIHNLFRRRRHVPAHLPHGAAHNGTGNGMGARPARMYPVFAIGSHPDMDQAGIDLPAGLPIDLEALRNA